MPPSKKSSTGSGRGSRRRRKNKDGLDLGSDKLYFKIGEVSEILGVPDYVLRYWEGEFPSVRPQKTRSKQRVYRRKDVETLLKIKHLLYERRFTIAGARQELGRKSGAQVQAAAPAASYLARQTLSAVHERLDSLRHLVETDEQNDANLAADPAAFVRAHGGALALLEGTLATQGTAQPLLDRPERSDMEEPSGNSPSVHHEGPG